MFKHLKPILVSGFAALLVAGSAVSQTEPPPAPQASPQASPPASPPASPRAAEQAGDKAITEKVMAAISADPALQGAEIAIETVGGEVHLNGYVGNPADVQKAAAIARGVAGVKSVKNSLKTK